jgi:PAS domain-containing protein
MARTTVAAGLLYDRLQGSVNYVNPAPKPQFGWTSANMLGKNNAPGNALHASPDGTPFPESDCACLPSLQNGNELREHEDVFVRNGCSIFAGCVTARRLLRGLAKTVGLVVGFRDDTYRREADRAVRESEQRFALSRTPLPL